MSPETATVVDNGHADATHGSMSETLEELVDSPVALEILAEIATIKASTLASTQQGEVAEKFLLLALGYAREGKNELAARKRKAARCVLTGEYDE